MRTIGYGSKGKAESVEKQVARELEIGRYCSLRTTVRGRRSTQDIALFIFHDPAGDLSGSGLVVVSFDTGGELAKLFADAWFEKTDASLRKGLPNKENNSPKCRCRRVAGLSGRLAPHYGFATAFCADRAWSKSPRRNSCSSQSTTAADMRHENGLNFRKD